MTDRESGGMKVEEGWWIQRSDRVRLKGFTVSLATNSQQHDNTPALSIVIVTQLHRYAGYPVYSPSV
jgi:hypothetical protein